MLGRGSKDQQVAGAAAKDTHDDETRTMLSGEPQEQLVQAQKMEAVGQLAGGVAHDFNNILNVITGYAELVLRDMSDVDPRRRRMDEIRKAADRATSLTRQLLAFSRKQVMHPQVLDLNAVVADVAKMLQRLIGEDIELVTIPDPTLGRVKADPGQMEQILLNLAVNARDAMPEGGRLTVETLNVDLDEAYAGRKPVVSAGPYVMLAVGDTGHGMSRDVQSRIFEPFFTTKEQGKGTGLGLAMVYGIVKQSGGSIWVYSEEGRGTTFKIYLPRCEGDVAMPRPATTLPPPGGSETILLAEDDPAMRALAGEVLETAGYEVLSAARGDEALEIARRHLDIDLLLTDVIMPGMGGRDLARRLREILPKARVLYALGYTGNAIVDQGILEEGLAFLQKPFDADSLAKKVREVLDGA